MVEKIKIYNPSEEGIELSGPSPPVPIGLEALCPQRSPIVLTSLERLSTEEVLYEINNRGLISPIPDHIESRSNHEALVGQDRSPLIYLLPYFTNNPSKLRPAEIKTQTYSGCQRDIKISIYTFDKEQEKILEMMNFGQVDGVEVAREKDFKAFLKHSWEKGSNFLAYD